MGVPQMTYTEARDLLEYFNKWRRDEHVPNSYEMPNPTQIGIAIDMAVEVITKYIKDNGLDFKNTNK